MGYVIAGAVGFLLGYNVGKRPEWVKAKVQGIIDKIRSKA